MTLHLPQPPAGAQRAVLAALVHEGGLPPSAAAVLRHAAGRPQPLLALPVHVLRGPAPRLAGAEGTGWRFLLRRDEPDGAPSPAEAPNSPAPSRAGEFSEEGLDAVVAAAEVNIGPAGPVFSHVTAGPYLDSTVRALRQAWQLTQGSPSRFEPRLLSLPEHYASALWLHSALPGEDLMIPLAPAPLGVAGHQVLPAAELLARLERSPAARPTALIG
ncbi:hypothetical protein [Streptomyces sp. TLI_171]|uniref:hypothetical protein n=1 Tax=Streptomyces sp. TLI_171 TaxID=1938859 RepID=UPI000C17CFFA|nr:hypothetical protein [Streptomyces sp. TLI_171]RKE22848.1 hypothetical protein BX266_6303 [Streptomyces sp. TLI_171]